MSPQPPDYSQGMGLVLFMTLLGQYWRDTPFRQGIGITLVMGGVYLLARVLWLNAVPSIRRIGVRSPFYRKSEVSR